MTVETSRRQFIRGAFASEAPASAPARPRVPRPCGAAAEAVFVAACTGCGDCARACPEQMIRRDAAGLPAMDFNVSACTFCGACIEVCETDALSPGTAWDWQAEVTASCLSATGVQCRACEDFCETRAIRFRPQTGGRALPRIDTGACTGCGACIAPCPAGAITLIETRPAKAEATGPATETRPC
ncbi:MAG: ferredoxin-type protein NapF [Maritimibacter sp.]|nr:ferredoxin-type protein NapF [Maritimibacter sp.]